VTTRPRALQYVDYLISALAFDGIVSPLKGKVITHFQANKEHKRFFDDRLLNKNNDGQWTILTTSFKKDYIGT